MEDCSTDERLQQETWHVSKQSNIMLVIDLRNYRAVTMATAAAAVPCIPAALSISISFVSLSRVVLQSANA